MSLIELLFKNKRKILKMIVFIFAIDSYYYAAENTEDDKELLKYRIVLLGDPYVGKTKIFERLVYNKFEKEEEYKKTVAVANNTIINGSPIKLTLFDTSSQELFKGIVTTYTAKADFIIVVYDISKRDSFTNTEKRIKEAKEKNKDAVFILVGNKIDLAEQRAVSKEEAENFAKTEGLLFFCEVSAKTGEGLSEILDKIINFKKNISHTGICDNCCKDCS